MAVASLAPAFTSRFPVPGIVAVVAPYGDGGRHARAYARHGWETIAVTLPDDQLPPAHRDLGLLTGYERLIQHSGLRRTAKKLRGRGVSAVVAGSGLGVGLADRLALALDLPGSDPLTSRLRRDRGLQATALRQADIAAPLSLRTGSLSEALRWVDEHPMPAYVVAPADTAATEASEVCWSAREVADAWRRIRREAFRQSGNNDLVVQEWLQGQAHLVHAVVDRHRLPVVTSVWSEQRITHRLHARSDLMSTHGLLARALSLYTARVVDALGIATGPVTLRLMTTDGGPVLLSARAYAHPAPVDDIPHTLGHVEATVSASITGLVSPPEPAPGRRFAARISLIAPHNGHLDARMLRTVTSLPTVARATGHLTPGTPVRRTVDRATSPGEIVLVADTHRALEDDARVIRSAEVLGLYDGAAR
ncbi:hypothetical protein [Streptomyces sp. NPDC058434]|uniref:hypothetical protein n=1 Tax=Streptomyces sp. NPDC058434 TaxID=3346498 RepID=UPI00364E4082